MISLPPISSKYPNILTPNTHNTLNNPTLISPNNSFINGENLKDKKTYNKNIRNILNKHFLKKKIIGNFKYSNLSSIEKLNHFKKENKSQFNIPEITFEQGYNYIKPVSKNFMSNITKTEKNNLSSSGNIKTNSFYFSILNNQSNLEKCYLKNKYKKSFKYDVDVEFLPRVEILDDV